LAVVPGELTLISRPQRGLADAAGQKRKASPQNQIINGPPGSNQRAVLRLGTIETRLRPKRSDVSLH
ncbi:hypothetical protein AB4Z43_09355, partial [Mesorhizobium sp. 2RAF45]|uniref:hypothetical protein n=1 Tax=Mesorhizobium sp. 2RAF45 TaxID=3233001 RepID=UPI003F9AC72D